MAAGGERDGQIDLGLSPRHRKRLLLEHASPWGIRVGLDREHRLPLRRVP